MVCCSTHQGGENGEQGGVVLEVKGAIIHQGTCSDECIDGCVMGRSKYTTLRVGHVSTEVGIPVKDVMLRTG